MGKDQPMTSPPVGSKFLAVALFALALPVASAQTVWNVGKNPGATIHFTTIQGAVDAAADGDIIRVYNSPGPLFAPFVIDGKSLTIVGILATTFQAGPGISGACAVRNLAPYQSVTIARLAMSSGGHDAPGLSIVDCRGGVLVVDSRVHVLMPPDLAAVPRSALHVERSTHVTIVDLDIWGGGAQPGQLPYSGVEVIDSRLDWFGGIASGGAAGIGTSPAGTALKVDRSTLRVVGSWINGGAGATASGFPTCTPGTQGGVAMTLGDAALVLLEDTIVQGGFGGPTSQGCPGGTQGAAIVGDDSGVVYDAASLRRLRVVVPIKAGSDTRFTVYGEPDDVAFVLVGKALAPVSIPETVGLLAIGDAQLAGVVTVPASGKILLEGVGHIPFAGDGFAANAQAVVLPASGGPMRVSAPVPVVILP
jgi:hypothetical protein